MQIHRALGTAALAFSLWAQADSPIEPHVDAGGVVSWTATIDAETVNEFIDTANSAVEQDSGRIAALGRWLMSGIIFLGTGIVSPKLSV